MVNGGAARVLLPRRLSWWTTGSTKTLNLALIPIVGTGGDHRVHDLGAGLQPVRLVTSLHEPALPQVPGPLELTTNKAFGPSQPKRLA